jgi:UDP-N-acetylglucosamine acyltransferase
MNKIEAYSVIGSDGEIRIANNWGDSKIGDGYIISELVIIQRPANSSQKTIIGNSNIIMDHTHIGHDATIGDNCELFSGTIIGGYSICKSN